MPDRRARSQDQRELEAESVAYIVCERNCGVCEPECPVDAIKSDSEPGLEKWLELNREYAQKWPNITVKKDMPKDAKAYWDEPGPSGGGSYCLRSTVWPHLSCKVAGETASTAKVRAGCDGRPYYHP